MGRQDGEREGKRVNWKARVSTGRQGCELEGKRVNWKARV